jgi:hypothetical protein
VQSAGSINRAASASRRERCSDCSNTGKTAETQAPLVDVSLSTLCGRAGATYDLQRATRFTWRCAYDHGQLFTFNMFLRERILFARRRWRAQRCARRCARSPVPNADRSI